MNLTISKGNTKLGKIPNISLAPIYSCPDAPCHEFCYAVKTAERWPIVDQVWKANLDFYLKEPYKFFDEVRAWLTVFSPKKFRWHVAGDIPSRAYLFGMMKTAEYFPKTKFMCFTKRYDMVSKCSHIPGNLSIILSAWPGHPLKNPCNRFPVAYIKGDPRAENYIECSGRCDACGDCFYLRRKKKNVLLKPLSNLKARRL